MEEDCEGSPMIALHARIRSTEREMSAKELECQVRTGRDGVLLNKLMTRGNIVTFVRGNCCFNGFSSDSESIRTANPNAADVNEPGVQMIAQGRRFIGYIREIYAIGERGPACDTKSDLERLSSLESLVHGLAVIRKVRGAYNSIRWKRKRVQTARVQWRTKDGTKRVKRDSLGSPRNRRPRWHLVEWAKTRLLREG